MLNVIEIVDQIMEIVPEDFENYRELEYQLQVIQTEAGECNSDLEEEAVWKRLILRLEEFLPVPIEGEWIWQIQELIVLEETKMNESETDTWKEIVDIMLESGEGLSDIYSRYLNEDQKQKFWESIFIHYDSCENDDCKLLQVIDTWNDIVLEKIGANKNE